MEVALAIDIGGTKLAAARVTADSEVLDARSVPTAGDGQGQRERPAPGSGPGPGREASEALWQRVVALVDDVRHGDEVVCGVGCGGPMRPGGETVSPLNIAAWRDFPLRGRLAQHLGMTVAVDNDAKALALGEGWRGAARGERDYLAMVVSTGVGGGIVLDGRLLDGAAGNAGHVGHVIVEPDGRRCGCGAYGCLEAEASGTALAAITGGPPALAPPELRRRTGTLVGRGVASVVNLLDLPLAVVAGSVALGFGETFFSAAQEELDARCRLEFARGARIVPAGLGAVGPLVGAAAVGWNALRPGTLHG